MTSNILASASAHALGCYIGGGEIFTGTPNDYVDDPFGCRIGQTDVGPFLVGAHEFIYAILITWPLALLSLVLFAWLFYRLARDREAEAPN